MSTEQEPMEVRLAHFRAKMEALKKSRVNDETIQAIGDVGKLGPEEMNFWDRYVVLFKAASGGLSGEALKGLQENVDALIQDLKQAGKSFEDRDIAYFFTWMANRMIGLHGIVGYLDDPDVGKEVLVDLKREKRELGL